VFARYRIRLYNFIRRFVGNQSFAEDIFQETFLRIYRERHRYEPRVAVSTWLYTIARNLCLHEIEKHSRRQPTPANATDMATARASPTDRPRTLSLGLKLPKRPPGSHAPFLSCLLASVKS